MVTISNFEGLLEIAFGLNALFYFFELIPHFEEKLTALEERYHALAKEKIELTQNHEVFPLGFVISASHPFYKRIFKRLTTITSLGVLTLIAYASFRPMAQMPTFWMCILLIVTYAIPFGAFSMHSKSVALAEAVNQILEDQIEEAKRRD